VIALIGATGRIGTHVAASLAEREVPARALVRDAARVPSDVEAVAADLRRPESLRAGLEGATRLFLLTPHGPDQDLLEAAAIDAALAAGVERVVKLSGGAASLGPNGTTTTAVAHWRGEQRIEASGVDFCFLRPSFLMQNLVTTAAPTVRKLGVLAAPMGHGPIAMVDARDVAACAVAALTADELPADAWQLTGPHPVTFSTVAELLGVPYLNVPLRLAGRILRRQGAEPWEVEHSLRMAAYFAAGSDAGTTPAVARLTGRQPRTLDAFLAEHADAFGGTAADRSPTPLARITSLRPALKGA
jgi:NAD(P)H dehydrogenase (quinone)